jgi:bifunctional polynucleotide phosphatase/kinase
MPPKKRTRAQVESEDEASNNNSEEEVVPARSSKRAKVEKKEVFKGSFGLKWEAEEDTMYYLTSSEIKPSKKVAAFDMDDTLVTPKSKAKFASGRNDWRWLFDEVVPKLKEIHKDGWNIVIFTNQAGVEKGKTRIDDITGKILDLAEELGFPIQACVATATNHWRKPHTSMWDFFVKTMRKGAAVDMKESVFVGDAAGRQANWKAGAKKDFSCTDRAFAHNIGLKFLTPDEYFLGEKEVDFKWGGIDPVQVLEEYKKKMPKQLPKYAKDEQELIIMVGQPASGKSTFSNRFLVPHGYVRVNRDTLKTPAKCLAMVEKALSEGKSAVVDNTNPDAASRAPYLNAAKKHKVPVRCFVMKTPRELADHMNLFRERQSNGTVRRIPDVGYNMFNKKFAAPGKSEGYSEVLEIDFMPQFDDDTVESWFKNRQE